MEQKYFGFWILLVALAISTVAAYYSIVGLVALFAAAAVPVIIMASVLEVGKISTAVWLHLHWKDAALSLKTYLTMATVTLMFITSMGIFGFLSKAYIEQSLMTGEQSALSEQINREIEFLNNDIERAQRRIDEIQASPETANASVVRRIEDAQRVITQSQQLIQPQIDDQLAIIARQEQRKENDIAPLQRQVQALENEIASLDRVIDELIAQNFITRSQQRLAEQQPERQRIANSIAQINDQISAIRNAPDSVIDNARNEIARLRAQAVESSQTAQDTIARLSAQLETSGSLSESDQQNIDEQLLSIRDNQDQIAVLRQQLFQAESSVRALEAEVGPLKYIAEMIYGESNESTLDLAVRWVIIIIVFVFDPLAVCLLLAGVWSVNKHKEAKLVPSESVPEQTSEAANNEPIKESDNIVDKVNTIAKDRYKSVVEPDDESEIARLNNHIAKVEERAKAAETASLEDLLRNADTKTLEEVFKGLIDIRSNSAEQPAKKISKVSIKSRDQ